VAFALLALGLIIPSAVAPWIASEWARGEAQARKTVGNMIDRMSMIVLPATVGLVLTSDRWMDWLFGQRFIDSGPWLALIAARIPFILLSNLEQTALTACRDEGRTLQLVLGMVALGIVIIPAFAVVSGVRGVAWGVLTVEAGGAVAGWIALTRKRLVPSGNPTIGSVILGCLALGIVCRVGAGWPLPMVVVAGITTYVFVLVLTIGIRTIVALDGRERSPTDLVGEPAS
jgi:O-antigen/teichoic acid export membrane protein